MPTAPALGYARSTGKARTAIRDLIDPQAEYEAVVAGQDLAASEVSLHEAAQELGRAIATSPPLEVAMYRGIPLADDVFTPPGLGVSMDVLGPTSFTTDADLALRFGLGVAEGQVDGADLTLPDQCIIIEVEPGARALDVARLSPWRRNEVLSAGRFTVVGVQAGEESLMVRGRVRVIPLVTRLRLRQVAVWDLGGE